MDALILILNDTVGIKDAWCAFGDSQDVEEVIHERVDDISYAPCTLDLARELVADIWTLHEEKNKPFPGRFFIYRIYLGQEPIMPRRRTPNLGAYMTETMVLSPQLVRNSEEMVEYNSYGGLAFASEEAYQFVRDHAPRRGRPRLSARNLDSFIEKVVPREIDQLLSRMAINLELEAIAGRATQKTNQIAAQTWLAISERVCPYQEIPFIYHLADLATQRLVRNLRMGFESQEQANQASLELEDAMMEYLDDLSNGWDHEE